MTVHHATIEQIKAERGEIGQDHGLGDFGADLGEDVGAGYAADHAGNDYPKE